MPAISANGGIRTKVVRARSPLRLGLAGGGTDLSPFCDEYGGAVLNATIGRYAHASVTFTGDDKVVLRADDIEQTETVGKHELTLEGPLALHRGVAARMTRDFLGGKPVGLTLGTMIDAPPGSGLGSSSALVVAMVEAFRVALDLPLGRYDVAHLAYEIERKDLGLSGGRQDQYASAFGGINFIEFLSEDRVIVNPLRLPSALLSELQASLVICFTGQSRASHDIISTQISRISERHGSAVGATMQLKEDAFEMKRALLRGDFASMAVVLNRSWLAKKETATGISNELIERLWTLGMSNGATGGKVSGAGGGGFLMFLTDPSNRAHLMRALKEAGGEPSTVNFSHEGVEGWEASF